MSKGPLTAMSNSQVNKGVLSRFMADHLWLNRLSFTCGGPDPQGKSSLAEIKNGKVIFKQKPHSFEKHSETLQELVKFREVVQTRVEAGQSPLTAIDDELKPLIAKLVHESDKTLVALTKHVHSLLLPTHDDEDSDDADAASKDSDTVPVSVIEGAILEVADRNNYGLNGDSGSKPPAVVCVWRWEVKEPYRSWLPKNAQDKVANRLAERIRAKDELASIFASLPEAERESILHIKSSGKSSAKDDKMKAGPSTGHSDVKTEDSQDSPKPKAGGEENETPEKGKSKASRPKKDTEKMAKAKKEKDAQKTLMTHFFTKPKAGLKTSTSKEGSSTVAGPSTVRSDFEKTFKPFVLKKDAQLAPINAFLDMKSKSARGRLASGSKNDVIVIEDEGNAPRQSEPSYQANVKQLSAQERMVEILASLPSPIAGTSRRPPRSSMKLKTHYPISVRGLFKQLSEAEVVGDTALVRSLHADLANRTLLPAKLFIFTEDARPGYYGTWTRSSRVVGARTPFAKDVLEIDYGYDSGEEWEEDATGDADDVMDADDDDGETEDHDSDMDDWLVDDDEVEEVPTDERSASPPLISLLPPVPKRKAEHAEKSLSKKRKVVVPLVPYARGPYWEDRIGCCSDGVFNPYKIRLLNDTPFAIDPFTFVSTIEEKRPVKKSGPAFVVPVVPGHLNLSGPKLSNTNTPLPPASAIPKKATAAPKTTFPDNHLPTLLAKVNTLQAANLTVLVEAVFQELRDSKVKKNAIEAKIKEVGEKCKERKFWVIKESTSTALPNGTIS